MNAVALLIRMVERLPLPDRLVLRGIHALVGRTARSLGAGGADVDGRFVQEQARSEIAEHTADANAQHYELPAAFFGAMLGPRRKYSCCLYESPGNPAVGSASDISETSDALHALSEAERTALEATCAHAELADGQRIVELGCGWGSLTLWMAERYPHAQIVAVSNSHSQRAFIEARLNEAGFHNVTVTTADANVFDLAPEAPRVDRVVSVEMFEHMANWPRLLQRVRTWLRDDGKFFVHIFTHRGAPYRFDHRDPADWIGQYFFTGGMMPSESLLAQFDDVFDLQGYWRWSGVHYARTARQWLDNFDREHARIDTLLRDVYRGDAALWRRRWRLFLLSTMGLFGYADGAVWGVSHYLMSPVANGARGAGWERLREAAKRAD